MKRKSILMTIVAMLFTTWAIGQGGVLTAWPASLASDVSGADTIYFCSRADSLYPIELGYDVAGKRLAPSFGEWSLIKTSSDSVKAYDYELGTGIKNGGAGNAFRVVGSGIGGYLFQYLSTDDQCGLDANEKYWVYVFILPESADGVKIDSTLCKKGSKTEVNFANLFQSKYTSLYAKANLNPKWRVKTSSFTTRTDSVGIYTYISKLGVKGKGYSCGDSIEFSYRLTVVDTIAPKSKSITLCWEDIMGDRGKLPVNDHFGRTESGSYSPSIVNNKDVTALSDTANSSKINVLAGWTDRRHKFYTTYEFSYKECGGAINKVYDSIFWIVDIAEKAKNWGIDTAMYCRSAGTANIIDIWATVEGLRPSLSQNNSYWKEFGLNQTGTPLNYGTVHGGPALNGYTLKIDSLKSNINYYFQWRPDGGAKPCYLAKDHKTDSGLMLVIIRDGIAPIDFTAQLCLSSYTKGVKFNLNDYTSLDLTWTGNEVVDGHNINLDGLVQGTHKYSYKLAGACGYPNGVGVFYIKATNRVKVSSSKTVKYCVNRLPSKINLNDILNVAVAGVTWTLESVKNAGGTDVTIMTGGNIANVLNTTSGILDIAEFGRQYTTGPAVLKFKTGGSNGPGCGVPDGTMVTLEFNAVL